MILNRLEEEQGCASVAAVMIKDRRLYYAAAGNVKVAVYRNQELVPVTSGHTIDVLARQKYEEGKLTRKEAADLLNQHRLYNFVGQDGFREIEFVDKPIKLKDKDIVALMSDGLYEGLEWRVIEEVLSGKGKCQQKACDIVELINADSRKGKDNGGIVLVEVAS